MWREKKTIIKSIVISLKEDSMGKLERRKREKTRIKNERACWWSK